jgi:hypothetical protein
VRDSLTRRVPRERRAPSSSARRAGLFVVSAGPGRDPHRDQRRPGDRLLPDGAPALGFGSGADGAERGLHGSPHRPGETGPRRRVTRMMKPRPLGGRALRARQAQPSAGVQDRRGAEEVDAQAVQRASRAVKSALSKRPGEWMSSSQLRRSVPSRVRRDLDDALLHLEMSGDIQVQATAYHGHEGARIRLRTHRRGGVDTCPPLTPPEPHCRKTNSSSTCGFAVPCAASSALRGGQLSTCPPLGAERQQRRRPRPATPSIEIWLATVSTARPSGRPPRCTRREPRRPPFTKEPT